jgi:hypothetical protein
MYSYIYLDPLNNCGDEVWWISLFKIKNAVILDVTSYRLITVLKYSAAFIFTMENSSTLKMEVVGS